jgi:hypothetical protein
MHDIVARRVLVLAALLTLAGCGGQPTSRASQGKTDAVTAAAPKEIEELTNQKQVWECPKCGMDYDGPGECTMDHVALVETKVDYICPADNQPVEKAGKCPRCAANARVVKSAIAAAEPAASPATDHN